MHSEMSEKVAFSAHLRRWQCASTIYFWASLRKRSHDIFSQAADERLRGRTAERGKHGPCRLIVRQECRDRRRGFAADGNLHIS